MKKIGQLVLESEGAVKEFKQGDIRIPKGKKLVGILLKVSAGILSTESDDLNGLTEAQKQALFDCFQFDVAYGDNKEFDPYVAVGGERMHRLGRFAFASQPELYDDTTSGLEKTIADDGDTTAVSFYMVIPLGKLWQVDRKFRSVLGLGRTQAKTLEVSILRKEDTFDTKLSLTGNVTVDAWPIEESCKGDHYGHVPYWREHNRTEQDVELNVDGFPLLVTERTKAHASTDLTRVTVKIDEEVIIEQMDPQVAIIPYNDKAGIPAEASLADVETILYQLDPDAPFSSHPTGKVNVIQDDKDLDTIALGVFYVPLHGGAQLNKQAEHAAGARGRNKKIKMGSLAAFLGLRVPQRLAPYLGAVFMDKDDREAQVLPGIIAETGKETTVSVPPSLEARAKAAASAHAGREPLAAANVARDLAAMIPGAIPTGRGFNNGSSGILAAMQSLLGLR